MNDRVLKNLNHWTWIDRLYQIDINIFKQTEEMHLTLSEDSFMKWTYAG